MAERWLLQRGSCIETNDRFKIQPCEEKKASGNEIKDHEELMVLLRGVLAEDIEDRKEVTARREVQDS